MPTKSRWLRSNGDSGKVLKRVCVEFVAHGRKTKMGPNINRHSWSLVWGCPGAQFGGD